MIKLLYLLVVLFQDLRMGQGNDEGEFNHDCVEDKWLHVRSELCEDALRVVDEFICSFEVVC